MGVKLNAVLDLLFPPHCVYCDKLVSSSAVVCCPKCQESLPWIATAENPLTGEGFRCICALWYEGAARDALLRYKFQGQKSYARAFAQPLAQAIDPFTQANFDLVSWIPVSGKTLKSRGYDQARLLAEALAALLDLPAEPLLSAREKAPQSGQASAAARRKNIQGVFSLLDAAPVQGRRVLLIDDVITTGATLEEAVRVLLRSGALEVCCAALCRVGPQPAGNEIPAKIKMIEKIPELSL